MAEATEKWWDTMRKDQTAYNIAFRTAMSFFEQIGQEEETAALFARYMRGLGQSEGLAMRHILAGFDWAGLKEGHIVDVSLSLPCPLPSLFPLISLSISCHMILRSPFEAPFPKSIDQTPDPQTHASELNLTVHAHPHLV